MGLGQRLSFVSIMVLFLFNMALAKDLKGVVKEAPKATKEAPKATTSNFPPAFPFGPITDLDGKPATIPNQQGAKYQVILWWATWCKNCEEKMNGPLLNLSSDTNYSVFTFNSDRDIDRAKAYMKKNNIKVPVFRVDKSVQTKYGVKDVPHWTVLKKQGSGWGIVANEGGWNVDQFNEALKK